MILFDVKEGIPILKIIYLKVRKVPTKITPQQAAIAEKIPVLINVVFFSVSF